MNVLIKDVILYAIHEYINVYKCIYVYVIIESNISI